MGTDAPQSHTKGSSRMDISLQARFAGYEVDADAVAQAIVERLFVERVWFAGQLLFINEHRGKNGRSPSET